MPDPIPADATAREALLESIHALRAPTPYRPSHEGVAVPIDDFHAFLLDAPVEGVKIDTGIRGSLRREDAAKLYELAHRAGGDVLDIGTDHGLSASIQSRALAAAGNPGHVLTVDLNPRSNAEARRSLSGPEHANVRFLLEDATKVLEGIAARGETYAFAFVDHSHEYEPVRAASALLRRVLPVGAYAAFHDFVDRRNGDPAHPGYDVVRGALDGLGAAFAYQGTCGCMGLFRRVA